MTPRDPNGVVKITFGMIVLNGEPFVLYNLQALYPFAHQIIVVEGACPTASSLATSEGHSADTTLETVRSFMSSCDPENKVTLVTAEDDGRPDGFWPEKDEMSQAYARRATGNYLWQIDVDEFYRESDMKTMVGLLARHPEVDAVSFPTRTFWGSPGFITDGCVLRAGAGEFHRLFRWSFGYAYASHRPPTVLDSDGRDLRGLVRLTAAQMRDQGIFLYHYSFLFPFQVEAKLAYYGPMSPQFQARRRAWVRNYYTLAHPFLIDDTSILGAPSWLKRFEERHPRRIEQLIADVRVGVVAVGTRPTQDLEQLVRAPWYGFVTLLMPAVCRSWMLTNAASERVARYCRGVRRRLRRAVERLRLCSAVVGAISRGWRTVLFEGLRCSPSHQLKEMRGVSASNGPVEAVRRGQFSTSHFADIHPKLEWYGRRGVRVLVPEPDIGFAASEKGAGLPIGAGQALLAGPGFFRSHDEAQGMQALTEAVLSLGSEGALLLYVPHAFAHSASDAYRWMPGWRVLHRFVHDSGLEVADFNPGFDRNGFYHLVALRRHRSSSATVGARRWPARVHYFYMAVGRAAWYGSSTLALSAAGARSLRVLRRPTYEHAFTDVVPDDVKIERDDLAIGHYGPWVTGARAGGATVILFGPGDRFRTTRSDLPIHVALQARGSYADQYSAAHLVVMHAGGLWRTADPWTYGGLCRWCDLPVSEALFPPTVSHLHPPGARVFCFVGLYDEHQKGVETAQRICEACPEIDFIAVGCRSIGAPNCEGFPPIDNRLPKFRDVVGRADFLVQPSRDDCQPGPPVECGYLGLLPIVSEYAGYVLSFPHRLDVNDIEQCARTIREANWADRSTVEAWQALYSQYLHAFHRPQVFHDLMTFYLQEAFEA